jgi:hypothetical protein
MTPIRSQLEAIVMRIQQDFLEKPDLHLTAHQAERRFAVNDIVREAVLDALVDSTVLTKAPGGAYVRLQPQRTRRNDYAQTAA